MITDSAALQGGSRTWAIGALVRAVADALEARFNPVTVRGEIASFSRAASGHCYFSLKDESGQLRCAMFRRAAGLLDFSPRDGDTVEVRGRVAIYEPRGDLQLIVESLKRDGQGDLMEQFLRLKAKLLAEGLFDAARKRPVAPIPRALGLVTSLGAAALHDVVTVLARRAPHVGLVLAPASVQGPQAPGELVAALRALYARVDRDRIDTILLVRGGGSIDDLAAFNDEGLARAIVESPVPLICGVGHETDFTIADFCADLRAPTPTAAAEIAAAPQDALLGGLADVWRRLESAQVRAIDRASQRLDLAADRLARPSLRIGTGRHALDAQAARLHRALALRTERAREALARDHQALRAALAGRVERERRRIDRAALRMDLLDPRHVLERGYALLSHGDGRPIARAADAALGERVLAEMADGRLDLTVSPARLL